MYKKRLCLCITVFLFEEVIVILKKHFFIKRLIHIIFVIFGISFLSFALIYISPTDPVRAMYSVSGSIPSEQILEQTRQELGLNDPFIVQYFRWFTGCLKGDFGTSISQNKPVLELLLARLTPTIELALLSLLIMLILAIPIGIYTALYKNTWIDYFLRGGTFVFISMPNFWIGLILLYIFAMKLKVIPVVSAQITFKNMLLPACTLAIAMTGKYARQVRTAILDEITQDYVIGARARGISERKILWFHIFPNAILPLITMLGLSLGSLLGGTSVVEIIFSYPALGSLAISAITSMDYPLIQGYVLWIALIYMIVNLLIDISYSRLDPRLRKEVIR